MQALNNETLIEAYFEAIHLQLDKAFIQLLIQEIETREMDSYTVIYKK
jgi:hypothetical protein